MQHVLDRFFSLVFECGQTGHVRTLCPNWRTNTPKPAVASTKGISVEGSVAEKMEVRSPRLTLIIDYFSV